MHCSPGLTLQAWYYAATLMAHTPNKHLIESIYAVREHGTTLSLLLIFDTEYPERCQNRKYACGWLCRRLLF